MKKQLLLASSLLLSVAMSRAQDADFVRLSQMDLAKVKQSYWGAQKNSAVTGEPISVAGVKYSDGVGTISNSTIKVGLGNSSRLTTRIAVNDKTLSFTKDDLSMIPLTDGQMILYKVSGDAKQFLGLGGGDGSQEKGSVVFVVKGDGRELYRSPQMSEGMAPIEVDVPLSGMKTLEMIVEDAGDGSSGDHAVWIEPTINYFEIAPNLIDVESNVKAEPMAAEVKARLDEKISSLEKVTLPIAQPSYDWLLDASEAVASVRATPDNKDIVLSNGLVSRVFRVMPNLATIDFVNNITGQSLLRAVSGEGRVVIDGKSYNLGGLEGQFEYGYTQREWVDGFTAHPEAFRVEDFSVSELRQHIKWKNVRWKPSDLKDVSGKVLTFTLRGQGELSSVIVKLNYAIYDGLPTISKWFELENQGEMAINLDSFILEQLAMAEPESPVDGTQEHEFRKPNVFVTADWGFRGMLEKNVDFTENWEIDPRYTSQCNYPMMTPCLLEVKLPMGPDATIAAGGSFDSFRYWMTPMDSEDRERSGLYQRRFYTMVAPWVRENPILMHCTSSDPKIVKEAIDQCVATGYEMVILSFGSGLNMEDESEENYAKYKALNDYALSKGVELGGYSLLSSRWISDEVDVINPKTGKRGGMIFGSSPCLSSQWGYDYFRKVKKFYEKTGMRVFENDGSYPGNVCASTDHAHHKGLEDSQWEQRKQIEALYRWMNETGIYMNIPDFGYILNGANKTGIGYREVNWSLPRERQLVLGRQVMYDGLWERNPSMCWTFVPLTQYHGGGAAATLEPLSEHLKDYKAHMIQNYGHGVQAMYRGHRLYDTEQTKEVVKEVIDWYKEYRDILNSDIIHLRRADGRDWDGILHVNPELDVKGMALVFNPLKTDIEREITLPLYYTGLSTSAKVKVGDAKAANYKLARDYTIKVKVTIPAESYVSVEIR